MAADVHHTNTSRTWLRSSHCNPKKNCVEVGRAGCGVVIRDSKSRFALRALDDVRWREFLAHCQAIC